MSGGAWTVDHFAAYCEYMVFDDMKQRPPEDWQLEIVGDIFSGVPETWVIVPEGNGKSTLLSQIALYGADFSDSPWIPIGAASAKQARIIFDQAAGFIQRTPELKRRFKAFGGYKMIRSLVNGGTGIEVYAHDPNTGDGVIPFPYAIVDELHRHDDLRLYSLWKGKLRKRGGQIITISTAGEPDAPFENMRDEIRHRATKRKRTGSHLRAEGKGLILHEWQVGSDEECADMQAVKAANPLSTITAESLEEDYASPTTDLGDWKRLKCNRPTRSAQSAITDKEWDDAQLDMEIPPRASVDVGLDVAWKWDTTAFVPLWMGWTGADLQDEDARWRKSPSGSLRAVKPGMRLLGPAKVLVPPRDGSSMHPDVLKNAMLELVDLYKVGDVVMDVHNAEDIAAWIEDELHVTVIDRQQGNTAMVADYNAFMDGLRNGTLRHTGDPDLRAHVLHAIARRLPGGDYRFDRTTTHRQNVIAQDRRVIDGLTAAAMVVEHSTNQKPTASVYDEMYG
jgi:hypothetical protein